MFAHIIELKRINDEVDVDIEEIISRFACSLESNGQILRDRITVKKDQGYDLYVTAPKCDSLESCHDSIYVKRDRELLNKYVTINVRQIGVDVDSQEYCSCEKRTTIEMQTFANDIDSVFTCCTCGKPIALYELPYLYMQDDHWYIVNWQRTYGATDTLWLDSLSDRFTGNQLVNVNSVLNKQGREIAKEISQKAGLKCYYNVFDDLTNKIKFTKINGKTVRLCPSCGKAMKYVKFCDDYERFICEDCMLSGDLPKDDPL
ncbi:MAG: DUF2310 family Zn-ribbon-containing protein [Clostridia bacterium]|nr:DUF2310 family Zn-ribbon-containing protein [Clostridia bacterium]